MTREQLYVAGSAAPATRTIFYVATHDLPPRRDDRVDQARNDPRMYAAREILTAILNHDTAARSATETIRDTLGPVRVPGHPGTQVPARPGDRRPPRLQGASSATATATAPTTSPRPPDTPSFAAPCWPASRPATTPPGCWPGPRAPMIRPASQTRS